MALSEYLFSWELMLTEFQRARQLRDGGPDALEAHLEQLALLPKRTPGHAHQLRILLLAQLDSTPSTLSNDETRFYPGLQDLPELLDWQVLFPVARHWRDHPEAATRAPYTLFSVGVYTLAALGRESDIGPLRLLIKQRIQHQAPLIGLEAAGIYKALDLFAQYRPSALSEVLPGLIALLRHGWGNYNSVLAAKLLALAETQNLEILSLVSPLVLRIMRDSARGGRRWTRSISHTLRALYPEAQLAQRIVTDLRLLALAQTIERGLVSKASLSPQEEPRLRRCWRWLGQSERLIADVSQEHWRADLLHRQVRRSRKARHRALVLYNSHGMRGRTN